MPKAFFLLLLPVLFSSFKAASQQGLKPLDLPPAHFPSLKILPQNFYKQTLPLSCKGELQLQKLTALPLYLRLGSKDEVDYLEKKPNAARPMQ